MRNRPLRERGIRTLTKQACCVASAVCVIAVPLAGCGGGGRADDGASVQAGLAQYFSSLSPEDSIFPYGDGPPRVKENGCRKLPSASIRFKNGLAAPVGLYQINRDRARASDKIEKRLAVWQCSVAFDHFTVRVHAAVTDRNGIVLAWPVYGDGRKPPRLSPARTYTG
jgi:hypothetical protein